MIYEVDFATCSAKEEYITKKGNRVIHYYVLFIDGKGVHILTRKGAVYLTPENAVVL